ncbi:MAG: VWA domain-containing protein, partial [Candidatus Niyogibacteria bacterium]|nr:VWA domain-containing protein [Candidatus Niyogibacteria bacterium]
MRNPKIFWMLAILALLAFGGCEKDRQPGASSAGNENAAATDSTDFRGWPPAPQEGDAIVLASDLLAQNYWLVFDDSNSMGDRACGGGGDKIDVAKAAVQKFINSIPAHANVGLSRLNVRGTIELGTGNRDALMSAVKAISASGGTPLRSAMEDAYDELTRQGQRQLGYGTYNIVMVTDGEANPGQDPYRIVAAITQQSPIVIHTIGFCIGSQHSLNQPGVTYYAEANNPEQLAQGLAGVLAEAPKFDVSV